MIDHQKNEIGLIGLHNDVLLPGERREFRSPVVTVATLAKLSKSPPEELATVCVSTPSELPGLVAARWVTVARIAGVTEEELVLEGLYRARVQEATGGESPYAARLLPKDPQETTELGPLLKEAHRLIAALDAGADVGSDARREALRSALLGLARATMTTEELGDALKLPAHETLRAQAQRLTVSRVVEETACQLEAELVEIAEQPSLSKNQRQKLWSQVIAIQRRLDVYEPGVSDSDTEEIGHLQRKLQQLGLPKTARVTAKRSLRLLRNMTTSNHDYSTYLGHVSFMAQLPWHPQPEKGLSLGALEKELDREHHGLEEPKRRILEYFAVRALGGKAMSTVLCLAGPPGVGKTSLARAIAKALDRPLAHVALGGMHDESEMRGHRLTFVAAAPGRILRGIADAGQQNCVMLLDELDKVSTATGRSPSAALLEVLDPQQNHGFRDNYLGVPYDLSEVLFICTANELDKIPGPLRDRLEVIELEGYTLAEKVAIAESHLLPAAARACGFPSAPVMKSSDLERLIEGYTREAGVRELNRKLSSLFRARALQRLKNAESDQPIDDDTAFAWDEIVEILGPERYRNKSQPDVLPVGVATGLSVTEFGGGTLFVEVGSMPGKGEIRTTGRLGEVMRESVQAALAHIKVNPDRYDIERRQLQVDLHLHLPEAAIAKEGPSAGIAVFAAMLSALRDEPLPADLAMTGEITLTGNVLPVGGVKAKLLAAERAGLKRVLIPDGNRADVPKELAIEVIAVERLADALPHLLKAYQERKQKPATSGNASAPNHDRPRDSAD